MYKKGNDEYLLDKIFKGSQGAMKIKRKLGDDFDVVTHRSVKNSKMKIKKLKPGPKIVEEIDLEERVKIKSMRGQVGFDYKGQFITDPTLDPSGRFDVDPKKYYKLTPRQMKQLNVKEEKIYDEVNPYTGQKIKYDEDAPANATGAAVAGTGDDSSVVVVRKKKKDKENKMFLDARTKLYKKHAEQLRIRREKRLEALKKSSIKESILSQLNEFDRESDLVENNIDMLRQIVKKKQNRPIKFSNGQMKVDLMTASAIIGVYDKVNKTNKAKIERMVNGDKSQFMKMQSAAFSLAK